MKTEYRVLIGLGVFLLPWTVVYWFTSYEEAGTALLAFFVVAFVFMGAYLLTQARRVGSRPEDRPDAEPGDGAGDLGWFPTASVWPLVIGGASTVLAYGLAFSGWLALPGTALMVVAITGLASEVQRSRH